MENKKNISVLYDSLYDAIDAYKESFIDFKYDEYINDPDNEKITIEEWEKNYYNEDDFNDYLSDMYDIMLDDMIKEMNKYEGFIAVGTMSGFMGKHQGFEVYDDFDEMLQSMCKDCDQIKVIDVDNKYLQLEAYHHDGGVHADIYALTSEGCYFTDDYLDKLDSIFNNYGGGLFPYTDKDKAEDKADILKIYGIDIDKELKNFNSTDILNLLKKHNMIEDIVAY